MNRIEHLRRIRSLTQSDLASAMGLNQTAISNWERGKTYPDVANQHKLADYFGVTIDYLLGRDNGSENGNSPYLDVIRYAMFNGLTLQEIKDSIDLLIRIKNSK